MKCPSLNLAQAALLMFAFIAATQWAQADGILRDGVGAISTGRGGTNLGFADNGNIILDNPGALTNIQGNGLAEIGFDMFFTDLTYSDPQNAKTSPSNDPFPMGQVSFIRKTSGGNIAWGIGAFSHAGFSTRYTLNGPAPFLGPQVYKSVGALMRILPSVSMALTPSLSVGGTLGAAVSHTELEGPYTTQFPTPVQGTPTLMDLQATGAGLSWSVGAQYLLTPYTTIGVSYQAATQIEADGSATLVIPGLGSSWFDLDLETEWPSTFGLGVTHKVSRNMMFATEVIWTQWANAKDGYGLLLSNPNNPTVQAVLGNSLPERFPLNWRDSVAVRLGFQNKLRSGQIVRAGYVYHKNIIPDSTLTPFIQATVEHSLSAGYGWQVGDYQIDLGYQYMFGPDRTVGTSGFIGGDFDNSTSTASAHWMLTNLIRYF